MKQGVKSIIAGFLGLFIFLGTVWAISPLELKTRLDQNKAVTLIDIRSTAVYAQGHIQNAINIPASILNIKHLPDLGYSIVYGDGIRTDITEKAVEALNRLKGVKAEMLEGGFAAWKSLWFITTHKKGISKKRHHSLSYQDLKKVANRDKNLVLIDLRSHDPSLTDLSKAFPGVPSIRMKKKSTGKRTGAFSPEIDKNPRTRHKKLYVLIDDGNGNSEKIAARLEASGTGRCAILTGGEQILKQNGRPREIKKVTIGKVQK